MEKKWQDSKKLGFGVLLVLLIIFVALFLLKGSKPSEEIFEKDFDNVYILEDDHYYLKRLNKDKKFEIESTSPSFQVEDEDGNRLDLEIISKKDNKYEILPPQKGYEEGKEYFLILDEGTRFTDENYQDARTLTIKIDRDQVEEYAFKDLVIETDREIEVLSQEKIKTDLDLKEGEILIGTPKNVEPFAYKIESVLPQDEYEVSLPALDEIYEEIDLYGEYKLRFSKQESDNIKMSLENSLRESDWFKSFRVNAESYGLTSFLDVSLENVDEALRGSIVITLDSDKPSAMGEAMLKNEDLKDFFDKNRVQIVHKFEMEFTYFLDVKNLGDMDMSLNFNLVSDNELTFEPKDILSLDKKEDDLAEWAKVKAFVQEVFDDNENKESFQFIYEAINYKQYLTVLPGLYFEFRMGPGLSMEGDIKLNFREAHSQQLNQGLRFKDYQFTRYYHEKEKARERKISLNGEAYFGGGLFTESNLVFIDKGIAYFSLGADAGFDSYLKSKQEIDFEALEKSKAEVFVDLGVFANFGFSAEVNYLLGKYRFEPEGIKLRKVLYEYGRDFLERSVKADDSKPYLEIEKVKDEVTVEEFFASNENFPYNIFPEEMKKKEDPHTSERIRLNIDSQDAREAEKFYQANLEKSLRLNRGEDPLSNPLMWAFTSVLDYYEEEDVFSMIWISGYYIRNSGVTDYELYYLSFDLNTGDLIELDQVLDAKDYASIQEEILRDAQERVRPSEDRIDNRRYPQTLTYVDTVFDQKDFDPEKIRDASQSYVYIGKDYPFMLKDGKIHLRYEIKYLENYSGETYLLGETVYFEAGGEKDQEGLSFQDVFSYQEVIDLYEQYNDNDELQVFENTNQVAYLYNMGYYDAISYTFFDLNKDGREEMLIAFRTESGFNLIDLYTIQDGRLIRLTKGHDSLERMGERIFVSILRDGRLYEMGSANGSEKVYAVYEISKDGKQMDKIKENINKAYPFDENDIMDLNDLEWLDITLPNGV